MDVDDNEWARPKNLPDTPPRTSAIRPDAVHRYGTDEMSIKNTADGTPAVVVPESKNRLQRTKEYIPVQKRHQPMIRRNAGLFVRYVTDYNRKERRAAAKSQ
ncbi:hypothetical protein BGZ68_002122 [Mortierella alpina]|nr:hypothetical protein BGZ68_002122 [Mortierella alpina]